MASRLVQVKPAATTSAARAPVLRSDTARVSAITRHDLGLVVSHWHCGVDCNEFSQQQGGFGPNGGVQIYTLPCGHLMCPKCKKFFLKNGSYFCQIPLNSGSTCAKTTHRQSLHSLPLSFISEHRLVQKLRGPGLACKSCPPSTDNKKPFYTHCMTMYCEECTKEPSEPFYECAFCAASGHKTHQASLISVSDLEKSDPRSYCFIFEDSMKHTRNGWALQTVGVRDMRQLSFALTACRLSACLRNFGASAPALDPFILHCGCLICSDCFVRLKNEGTTHCHVDEGKLIGHTLRPSQQLMGLKLRNIGGYKECYGCKYRYPDEWLQPHAVKDTKRDCTTLVCLICRIVKYEFAKHVCY